MKKMILAIAVFVTSLSFTINVHASINNRLYDYAKQSHFVAGDIIKLSDADLVRVERFLIQNEISDVEASGIISKLDEIKIILDNEGTSNITKISKAKKQEILNLVEEAASYIGATVSYDNSEKVLYLYKNGVKIEAIQVNPYLKQTGASNYIILSASSLILAGAILGYRKYKNASN